MQKINENRINSVLDTALKNINSILNVNTVVGKPIETNDDTIIIPITKVTLGILAGGGEYGKLNIFTSAKDLPFSAGNGAVVNIKPCAFLVKQSGDSEYKILSVGSSPYDKIFDKGTEILEKIINSDGKNEQN